MRMEISGKLKLREEIWKHDGKIIDGRHRYRACNDAKVKPRYRDWDGEGDLVKFVVSLNLHRRHLTPSQAGMVAATIANLKWGEKPEWSIDHSGSNEQAAGMMNVSERSVRRARIVRDNAVPELIEAVESGEISISAAASSYAR